MSIRDKRRGGWYWVDNAVLDRYSAELGVYGIAVYSALARLASNETRSTIRSAQKIATLLSISRRKVIERLQVLARLGLIEIVQRQTSDGDCDVNQYLLLDPPRPAGRDTARVAEPARPSARKEQRTILEQRRARLQTQEDRRIAALDQEAQQSLAAVHPTAGGHIGSQLSNGCSKSQRGSPGQAGRSPRSC